MRASNLVQRLATFRARAMSSLAVVDSPANASLGYGALYKKVTGLEDVLFNAFNYKEGDAVGMVVPNSHINCVAHLACAKAGLTLVTAKTAEGLLEAFKSKELKDSLKGVIVAQGVLPRQAIDEFLVLHLPIVYGEGAAKNDVMTIEHLLDNISQQSVDLSDDDAAEALAELVRSFASDDRPFAYYNSVTRAVTRAELTAQGAAVAKQLSLTSDDKVCIPVTLNHSMGSGFGLMAALHAGASIVLPSPTPDPHATLAALKEEECTVLFADSHTLKTFTPMGLAKADLPALRTGLIKVGSGEAFGLGEPRLLAGTELVTVGKPPSP